MNVIRTKLVIVIVAIILFACFSLALGSGVEAGNAATDAVTDAAIGAAQNVGVTIIEGAVTSTRFDGVDLAVYTDGNLVLRLSDGTLIPLMGCGYTGRQCAPKDNVEPTGFGWNVNYRGYIWEAECDCYAIQNFGEGYFATKTPCNVLENSERIVR